MKTYSKFIISEATEKSDVPSNETTTYRNYVNTTEISAGTTKGRFEKRYGYVAVIFIKSNVYIFKSIRLNTATKKS